MRHDVRGMVLLEALVAIVIFAVGALAFVGLQAFSFKASGDAKYRADAALMADTVVGQMSTDIPNLVQYAHNPNGGVVAAGCRPNASPSINANVREWTTSLAQMLPNASADRQQIIVDPSGEVTIRICWQAPQDTTPSNYIMKAAIQ